MRVFKRPLLLIGGLLVLSGGLMMACGGSVKGRDQVHVLTWKGDVNPVMERYIDRGLSMAERSNARAVVLRLDTPGGLDSAMRKIIQRMESSSVPVLVYVAPSGGRAASAGTFITMAGQVAAMAPGTTIGAASPINSNGADIQGTLGRKVTNDAVAYIRGIADLRGRNADWAEQAVRDAVAASDTEAVSLHVVDFQATSLKDLLTKADGRSVEVATGTAAVHKTTLQTAGVPTLNNDTTFFERVLDFVSSPDIAFLLLNFGLLAIVTEVFHPSILMGVFGAISLVLGFFALGELPTNWAGVGLILLGFALLALEIHVAGFGVLGVGGIVSLILGGLILTGGSEAGTQVSRWLVIGVAGIVAVFLLAFVGSIVRIRRLPAGPSRLSLIGKKGTARTRLDPRGFVYVGGERWEAIAEDGPLDDGDPVIVTQSEGLLLQVKRDPASIKLLPATSATSEP